MDAGDLDNMTTKEAFQAAQWFSHLGDWLADKEKG